jgi:hypothetical protein
VADSTLLLVSPTTVYVVYVPYLPLTDRIVVGEWELIPRQDLQDADALDARTAELARGFAGLHDLRDTTHAFGAFARPRDGRVGDDPGSAVPLVNLRRALLVEVLDGNQSPLTPEDERDPNAGHAAMTSENALVVANGISYEGGYTGTRSGGRVPTLNLRSVFDSGFDQRTAYLPLDDQQVYKRIQLADTVGVFQIESRAQMARFGATVPRASPTVRIVSPSSS